MTKRFLVPISTDHVDFNLVNNFVNATGRLRWDSEEGTLDLGMNGDVVQSVGMEFYMPPTKNNSGIDIPNGSFVMATGAQGDRITIAKAVTDGSVDPMFMVGVATQTVANGSETGLITVNGTVRDVDTSLWDVGTTLYPDPENSGGFIATRPSAPNIKTPIAIVLRKHAQTGRIYVRMTNGSVLGGSDSNVNISSPQNGDLLQYNSTTGIWENFQYSPVVPSGSSYPTTNIVDGQLFYNTSNGRTAINFGSVWKEFAYLSEISTLDNGNSSTTLFSETVDGGDSSTIVFAGQYDGAQS